MVAAGASAMVLLLAACAPTSVSAQGTAAPAGTSSDASTTAAAANVAPAVGTVTSSNWTVYHHDAGGSGAAPSGLDLSPVKKAWTSPVLDGNLYGEPLVWGKLVYVATENDTVYALLASNGTVKWHRHLAKAVPVKYLKCGNISRSVGITSTPVVDAARSEIFVVADELVSGAVRHVLYGLNATTGLVEHSQRADPPRSTPPELLQRASLTLDNGRVVFGFGGNYGDCEPYHGWVESVPVAGGTPSYYEVDSGAGQSQGAVWMGGAAPIVASNGDIWVATGNGSVTSSSGPYDHGDSVLELSPSLKLLQHFAPADWYSESASDSDLGSAVPAVLPNGLVVQAGKSRTAYLLRASSLGGIGHPLATMRGICAADLDGGVAFRGGTVYLPCESGVVAFATHPTTGTLNELWHTATGAGGPPILAGGFVWTIGGGTLYALNPKNGSAAQHFSLGSSATSFPTPSVGAGLVLATSATQVHAFAGP